MLQLESERRIPCLPGKLIFLLMLSTDWMRPTHIMEGNLLYSEPADLNVNHIKKITFITTVKLVFYQYMSTMAYLSLNIK